MTKHHYVRVYAHGPNAFWYKCAQCGGKGYTEEGYDVTYADLCAPLPTKHVCEACYIEDWNNYETVAEYEQRIRDAAEGFK